MPPQIPPRFLVFIHRDREHPHLVRAQLDKIWLPRVPPFAGRRRTVAEAWLDSTDLPEAELLPAVLFDLGRALLDRLE